MDEEIISCFGVNLENLDKEFSVVNSFTSENGIVKFDEGLIQRLFKVNSDQSLPKCDSLVSNHQNQVFSMDCQMRINNKDFRIPSKVIDMQIYQSTLYVLYSSMISIYNLPEFQLYKSYETSPESSVIKVRNFGDLVYVQSPTDILRIESLNFANTQVFQEGITSMDSIQDSDTLICVSSLKTVKILHFHSLKQIFEFEVPFIVDQLFSINEKTLYLYSQEQNSLSCLSSNKKQITFTLFFNSKIPKLIEYCEETEQFVVLNKNSCKFFVFTLDEEARISTGVSFGLRRPAEKFSHLVIVNDLRDQALYEGNSLHKLWIFYSDTVEVINVEVVATKTIGFRFGDEMTALSINENYLAGVEENNEYEEEIKEEKIFSFPIQAKLDQFFNRKEEVKKPEKPEKSQVIETDKIQKAIFQQFGNEKINAFASQIVFKLEEILPDAIKSVFSQAYPVIHKGISDTIRQSLPELETPLLAGLSEIKNLQAELARTLESLGQSEESLAQIIENFDNLKVRTLLSSGKADKVIEGCKDEELFKAGYKLFELSLAGNREAADLLTLVSKKLPHNSEKFPEFYMKVTSTSCELVKQTQEVLESLF